jgi:acyl carrier protein
MEEIKKVVKEFLLREFLPGENPEELTDSTPLITGGILDSIATLKLVEFLENKYGFEFQPHEVDAEHLNTVSHIAQFVQSKL